MKQGLRITVNGTELSEKLSGYKLSFSDNNKVTQAADGTTHIQHLRQTAALELTWANLTNDDIAEILQVVDYNGRNYIQYYDYTKLFSNDDNRNAAGHFYVEGRDASITYMDGNKIYWENFSLRFIEH